jgi:hypothetical protein
MAERPKCMTTDLLVGEALIFSTSVGGSDVHFGLHAKAARALVAGAQVDNVQITLTISSKHGQRARVRVQAPESVRITKPDKQAA